MKLSENIFVSIQGEGPYAGYPSTFIRVSGCVLRCPFCDTKYSWSREITSTYEEITEKCLQGPRDVVITGGEPIKYFFEKSFIKFLKTLISENKRITFETTFIPSLEHLVKENLYLNYCKIRYNLGKYFDECYRKNFIFVVSPKIDINCYPTKNITFEDICNYYSKFTHELYSLLDLDGNELYFKIIYDSHKESEVLRFLDHIRSGVSEKNILVMPLTPIPYHRENYVVSCQRTVEFCIREGLRYCPRIHIDIWGNIEGV